MALLRDPASGLTDGEIDPGRRSGGAATTKYQIGFAVFSDPTVTLKFLVNSFPVVTGFSAERFLRYHVFPYFYMPACYFLISEFVRAKLLFNNGFHPTEILFGYAS